MERPFILRPTDEDRAKLEQWRGEYADGSLELPYGWEGDGFETIVVKAPNGRLLLSLTGTMVVALDPLIKNPDADPREIAKALDYAEATLTWRGAQGGAIDSYIAVPEVLQDYIKFLEKRGYKQTAEHCVIMRRSIVPQVDNNNSLELQSVGENS